MKRRTIYLAICLILSIGFFPKLIFGQEVTRVEPPCWWIGFSQPEFQIMLYGDAIGDLDPVIKNSAVTISKVVRVENPNYLFVYLNVPETTKAGEVVIQLYRKKRVKETLHYPLKSREGGSRERVGFNNSDVICLITPDRFANGDPENDQIQGFPDGLNRRDKIGRHGGDIKGISDHLDYLERLGYTALWINPLVENNQPRASYHGYAATDFYKIDPRFGSINDYVSLVKKAGRLGIKVIMDQIMNHCGSNHWWMKDLPSKDWIHFPDHYVQTNHLRTTINDPYASDYDRTLFTDGWFVRSMPDMNQSKPLLADYLIQNSIWWIEYAGLSGIRHDTHSYAGSEFMGKWSCRIMTEYPNFSIVGEEWSLNPAIIAKWQRGADPINGQISCMPNMFDFPLQSTLVQALTDPEKWNSGWINVYGMLANDFLYPDPFNLVVFPDNHDMDRFFTAIKEDYSLYKLGLVFFSTIRGIPQFYYGTEILMTNANPGDHGLIRTDFPGGWLGDSVNAFTGVGLDARQREAQQFFQNLLNWRRGNRTVQNGKLKHFAPSGGVYCYVRYIDDSAVFVVLNKGVDRVILPYEPYAEVLSQYSSGHDVLSQLDFNLKNIQVEAKSALVLELKQ